MKTKKIRLALAALIVVCGVLVSSCEKTEIEINNTQQNGCCGCCEPQDSSSQQTGNEI